MKHYSVMKNIAIENLNIKDDGIYLDATLGYAGHSTEILKRITKGHLFAIDTDNEALEYSYQKLLLVRDNFTLIHSNFLHLAKILQEQNIPKLDGFIFDLGLSSPEIDESSRGFSFMQNAILDMRMDKSSTKNAKTIVNTYSKEELTNIFYQYGEEKESRKIADLIVKKRLEKEITHTLELVEIIKKAVGANYFYKHHPERVIFQALRIEVNAELEAIKEALPVAINHLKKGGRIVVITFHSLEDRIVKNIFKEYSETNEIFKGLREEEIPLEYKPLIKLVNKKPILPSEEELIENSRSKSAKLRVIERI